MQDAILSERRPRAIVNTLHAALLVTLTLWPRSAIADYAAGPRISWIHRGMGYSDIGVGAGATIRPLRVFGLKSWRTGFSGSLLGTGFFATSPGIILDLQAHSSILPGDWEIGVNAGVAFMSVRMCGIVWCGRQTGLVPSGRVEITRIVHRSSSGTAYGVVAIGEGYWVPSSVVLPGFNGRAQVGIQWIFGGRR